MKRTRTVEAEQRRCWRQISQCFIVDKKCSCEKLESIPSVENLFKGIPVGEEDLCDAIIDFPSSRVPESSKKLHAKKVSELKLDPLLLGLISYASYRGLVNWFVVCNDLVETHERNVESETSALKEKHDVIVHALEIFHKKYWSSNFSKCNDMFKRFSRRIDLEQGSPSSTMRLECIRMYDLFDYFPALPCRTVLYQGVGRRFKNPSFLSCKEKDHGVLREPINASFSPATALINMSTSYSCETSALVIFVLLRGGIKGIPRQLLYNVDFEVKYDNMWCEDEITIEPYCKFQVIRRTTRELPITPHLIGHANNSWHISFDDYVDIHGVSLPIIYVGLY